MTGAALAVLAPHRFVLMVEGAHIDKQSHLMAGYPANAVDRDPESDRGFFLALEILNGLKRALGSAASARARARSHL